MKNILNGGVVSRYLPLRRERQFFVLSIVVLRLVIDVLHQTYVPATWGALTDYNADLSVSLDVLKYIESWVLLLLLAFNLPTRLEHPSDAFLHILGIGLLIPMTAQFGMVGEARWIIYVVTIGYFIISGLRRASIPSIPAYSQGSRLVVVICAVSVFAVVLWMMISGGLNYLNFDFRRVYEYRADVNSVINRGFMAYLNSWAYKVFNVFLFSYALLYKRWFLALLALCIQCFFFGISGQKAVLFYPFLVLACWFVLTRFKSLLFVPISFTFLLAACGLLWAFSSFDLPASLFIRRLLLVPANVVFDYYYFFSDNPHIYWSNSFTRFLFDYPYTLKYPHLIGEYQGILDSMGESSGKGIYVNSSFIATGYMQAGFAGLFLYCVITAYLFRILDGIQSKEVPSWFVVAVSIVPVGILVMSADLPTAILTHGIAVTVILLCLIRSDNEERV